MAEAKTGSPGTIAGRGHRTTSPESPPSPGASTSEWVTPHAGPPEPHAPAGPSDSAAVEGNAVAHRADSAMDKVLRILEATAASPHSRAFGEIAAEAHVGRPSAHRLLTMLGSSGYVTVEGGGRYATGPRLRALAATVSAVPDGDEITDLLRALQEQVGGNTVHLSLRAGDRAVYIAKVNASHPYQMASRVGMRIPMHCTAAGKCILAGLTRQEVADVLAASGLPARTPATITDRRSLDKELTGIRARGYALDDEENESTIRCIAVPLRSPNGAVVGGISISTVTFAVPLEELVAFAGPLQATATVLSRLRPW